MSLPVPRLKSDETITGQHIAVTQEMFVSSGYPGSAKRVEGESFRLKGHSGEGQSRIVRGASLGSASSKSGEWLLSEGGEAVMGMVAWTGFWSWLLDLGGGYNKVFALLSVLYFTIKISLFSAFFLPHSPYCINTESQAEPYTWDTLWAVVPAPQAPDLRPMSGGCGGEGRTLEAVQRVVPMEAEGGSSSSSERKVGRFFLEVNLCLSCWVMLC